MQTQQGSLLYLDGHFQDISESFVPIMDRGLLFGDSIYEVIPEENGQLIAFELHIDRMNRNLNEAGFDCQLDKPEMLDICTKLIEGNGRRPIYIQMTRGGSISRSLGYSKNEPPRLIAFSLAESNKIVSKKVTENEYKLTLLPDIRWGRCDIKSTSMLGATMLFEQVRAGGFDEAILFNENNEITEGCAVNIFMVKEGVISTPPADNQILAGITRHILLSVIKAHSELVVEERAVSKSELLDAEEIFLTSSTKGIGSVVSLDDIQVGDGMPGRYWKLCSQLYEKHKFSY